MTPTSLRQPMPEFDATRHWLTYPGSERAADGTARYRAMTLDEAVAFFRPLADAAASSDNGRVRVSRDIVSISRERATLLGDLLEELALRLKPGLEVGPIQSDGSFSRFARELAEDMYRRADP